MYDVLKNHLTHGTYTAQDSEERINYFVASGHITPTQANELRAVAGGKAGKPDGLTGEVRELRQEAEELRQANNALSSRLNTVEAALIKTAELSLSAAKREQVQALFAVAGAHEEDPDSAESGAQPS